MIATVVALYVYRSFAYGGCVESKPEGPRVRNYKIVSLCVGVGFLWDRGSA